MRRWLYFVVSCSAAIGIACGGDSGPKDAAPDAKSIDAAAAIDARPIDASSTPDAAPDARIDAAPLPDVILADARPDGTICPPSGGCTGAGTICLANGQEQNCQVVNGCPVPMGAPAACGQAESCKPNLGCTCDHDAACPGTGTFCSADGTQVITCGLTPVTMCRIKTATTSCLVGGDTPTNPADDIALKCGGAAGMAFCGCPDVVAPANAVNGTGCTPLNNRTCSKANPDGSSDDVLKCINFTFTNPKPGPSGPTSCLIWDNGTRSPNADGTNPPGDACSVDGLSCNPNNIQCECPRNDTSDIYVNGHPQVQAKRLFRPQLVQRGNKFPAICSFESISIGLKNALQRTDFGHSGVARVIIDNCNDGLSDRNPATTDDKSCTAIRFTNEVHPWQVPDNIAITTVEDPGAGGSGVRHPDDFIAEVNNWTELDNRDGWTAAVNVSDGGRISGFALIEGGCDINGDGVRDEFCYDKFKATDYWPNVMVALYDFDTFRFNPGTTVRDEPKVEAMHIIGGGGPAVSTVAATGGNADCDAANLTGGTLALDATTGYTLLTPSNAKALSCLTKVFGCSSAANDPCDSAAFIYFAPAQTPGGTATQPNSGTFGPVAIVKDKDNKDVIAFRNSVAVAGAATAFSFLRMGDIDVGLMVGRDDKNYLDDGGPGGVLDDTGEVHPFSDSPAPSEVSEHYRDTNALIDDVRVSHFSSSSGGVFFGARSATIASGVGKGLSRVGVLVDDDFFGVEPASGPQNPGGTSLDRVQFNGGRLWVNDTGMGVTDGHVIIGPLGEANRFEVDWSTGQGIEVNDETSVVDDDPLLNQFGHRNTTVVATNILVHNTQVQDEFDTAISSKTGPGAGCGHNSIPACDPWDSDDLDGNGINVTGNGGSPDTPSGAASGATQKDRVLDMVGGNIEANDINGLSIVNIHGGGDLLVPKLNGDSLSPSVNWASIRATGTTFGGGTDAGELGNGWNGVRIRYGARTTLVSCTISQNFYNGVYAEETADGHADIDGAGADVNTGYTRVYGGIVDHNGVGAFSIEWGDDYNTDEGGDHEFVLENNEPGPDDDAGNGILARGNATVETNSADKSTTMPKLLVKRNGISGLYAEDGQMTLSNTEFRENGPNSNCQTAVTGKDSKGFGVGITMASRMTMTNCFVNENLGAGLIVNDDGAPLVENPDISGGAKVPQIVAATAPNTVAASQFNKNAGRYDDACDDNNEEPWPRDGVEVMRRGRLFFVDAASQISGNGHNGLDVAGQVPFPADAVGDKTEVNVDTNGDDGIVSSCHELLDTHDNDEPVAGTGAVVVSKWYDGNKDEVSYVCGFVQLDKGQSHDNRKNGVRVNGYLTWSLGVVDENDNDGVVVDHAEVANHDLADSFALGWTTENTGEAFLGNDGNFRIQIQSKFVDMVVHDNVHNGYSVIAAPWANEVPSNVVCGDDPSSFNDASSNDGGNANHTPDGTAITLGTDIETTTPVCDWGFEIRGLGGEIRDNGDWAVQIGDDDSDVQRQNIFAKVGDANIFFNGEPGEKVPPAQPSRGGIDVHQGLRFGTTACDDGSGSANVRCECDHSAKDKDLFSGDGSDNDETVGCTATTILSNDISANGGPGLYMRRAFQKALATDDRRTIASNEVHYNAVSPQDGTVCTVEAADQFASNIVFDGPIGQTDPKVSNVGEGTGTGIPCIHSTDVSGSTCIGPHGDDYPADYRCYWGASDSNGRPNTPQLCNELNNPGPTHPESGGVNNHCLWNGTQCRIAWEMGGQEGISLDQCEGSGRNLIYAYINESSGAEIPARQRGVFATRSNIFPDTLSGAYVRARINTWGIGGAVKGVFADSVGDSRIDAGDECSSESRCP